MPVRVHIPSMLRHAYGTQSIETVEADSIGGLAEALDARFPGLRQRLLEPSGRLRRYVHVFVNGEDARREASPDTGLAADAEVWIVGNVAGG
ncbi:MAG TPA: MoaD/ThiS family protein [Anaerolineales bacterium]|nr:MoaD/ThiS family protein [Anaerolineales bacterium]